MEAIEQARGHGVLLSTHIAICATGKLIRKDMSGLGGAVTGNCGIIQA